MPHTGDEGNPAVENEFFDTRQAFLSLCQVTIVPGSSAQQSIPPRLLQMGRAERVNRSLRSNFQCSTADT